MQLCDEGIEIDSTIFQENSHRNLRISQGPDLGVVFDLDPYNTGYAISVHLVASSRLYLAECFIESDWHPEIELEEFDDCRPKFGPVVYRPQDVLNSKVQERAALSRGRVVEGYLLARGQGPIPSSTRNGTYGVRVTILDTLGASARAELRITLNRPAAATESSNRSPRGASIKVPRTQISRGNPGRVSNLYS